MTLRLFITPRAAREIRRAAEWWAANRPAAPGAIRTDMKAMLDVLREQPSVGMEVEDASAEKVRRFYLDRIRYGSTTGNVTANSKCCQFGIPVAVPARLCSAIPDAGQLFVGCHQ